MAEEFTAKFSVDISDLKKNIAEANKQIKLANATFKAETSGMDDWAKSADGVSKKIEQLDKILAAQKIKLSAYQSQLERQQHAYEENGKRADALKLKLQQLAASGIDKASSEYQNLEKELKNIITAQNNNGKAVDDLKLKMLNQQAAIGKTERDIRNYGKSLADLGKDADNASGNLDSVGKAAHNAGDDAEKGSEGFTILKGVVADLTSRVISAAVDGLKRLGEKVIETGKLAIENYATYEQLVGGVETLFKDSAPEVLKYAQDAYKTAGMSANEYLENITGFSASLLQGLGGDTKKAAQIGDMAIRDMSDNANKMGTDISSITHAYQGFAKQNYSMLDNLKLGYGGSASEMARLVNESGVLDKSFKATAENVKEIPFDKLIEAIHAVQNNMGITGTTSIEASETISGSVSSMKAAWSNLMTSLVSDNGDIDKSIDEFADTAILAVDNIAPRIRNFFKSFREIARKIVTDIFPKLKKEIPELEPLINIFEWFIKNKNAVGSALKFIVAAFAAKKIYDFAKGVYEVGKGIKSVMKMLTSHPWALAIAGISALVVGIFEATKSSNELSNSIKKTKDEVLAQKEAIEELEEAQRSEVVAGLSELNHYEELWRELKNLVDVNGEVKKGQEERAKFIMGELSEALGIEIGDVDNLKDAYEKLGGAIDENIKKKRASIILEGKANLYKEAVENYDESALTLKDAEDNLRDVLQDQQEFNAKLKKMPGGSETLEALQARRAMQARVDEVRAVYDDAYKNAQRNLFYIRDFESAQSEYNKGNYDNIKTNGFDPDLYSLSAEEQADELEKTNKEIKLLQREIALSMGESADSVTEGAEEMAQAFKGLPKNIESVFKVLDLKMSNSGGLSQLTRRGIPIGDIESSKANAFVKIVDSWIKDGKVSFEDAGQLLMEYFEKGIEGQRLSTIRKANSIMKSLVSSVKTANSPEELIGIGQQLGDYIASGLIDGIQGKQLKAQIVAKQMSKAVINQTYTTFEIASPSKVMMRIGRFVAQGLINGIESYKAKAIDAAKGMSNSLIGQFDTTLGAGDLKASMSGAIVGRSGVGSSVTNNTKTVQFNQYNTSPRALSRIDIYRDTRNLLALLDT